MPSEPAAEPEPEAAQIARLLSLMRATKLGGAAERYLLGEWLARAEDALEDMLDALLSSYERQAAQLESAQASARAASAREFERRRTELAAAQEPELRLVREEFAAQLSHLLESASFRKAEVQRDLEESEPQLEALRAECARLQQAKDDEQRAMTQALTSSQMADNDSIRKEIEEWERQRRERTEPLRRMQDQVLSFNSLDFQRLQNDLQRYVDDEKRSVEEETDQIMASLDAQNEGEAGEFQRETLSLLEAVVSQEGEAVAEIARQQQQSLSDLETRRRFLSDLKAKEKSDLLSSFEDLCRESVESEVAQRSKEISECESRVTTLAAQIEKASREGDACILRIQELFEESHAALEGLRELRVQRRKLTDYIYQMVGNARVVLVEKPLEKMEFNLCTQLLPGWLAVTVRGARPHTLAQVRELPQEVKHYDFFASLAPKATLGELHEVVRRFVDLFTKGYSQTFLCYGEGHSGKLHTVIGHPGQKGLFQQIVEDVFSVPKGHRSDDISVSLSVTEIFYGLVVDLLRLTSKSRIDKPTRDDPFVPKSFEARKFVSLSGPKKAMEVFSGALRQREESSSDYARHRNLSTLFVTLRMSYTHKQESEVTFGDLNVVVLPGSEHNEKSADSIETAGDLEGARDYVSNFSRFLKAVKSSQPFHLSPVFTETLQQNCLNGNSNLLLLLHVIPRGSNLDRVLRDLDLGELAESVRLGSNPRNLTARRKGALAS